MAWLITVRVLCVAAFGLSAYMLYGSVTGERLPGCGLESGCEAVMKTRWAYIFRVPVSLPAMLLYASVFSVSLAFRKAAAETHRRMAAAFLVGAAGALMGAAAWFIFLQLFVIGSICRFCMAAHGCGLVIGALVVAQAFRKTAPSDVSRALAPARRGSLILAGLFAVVFMGIGQALDQPKTFAVDSAAKLAARQTPRLLQLHEGAFTLDLHDVPLRGSPDAPCVIVHLFDYSCPHCRDLDPILKSVCRELSNRVAIASLLVPLATNCNRVVKRVIPVHTNACDYAIAGLAVWRANPAQLPRFEEWIFASNRPPSPEAVRAEAMRLVGTNQFERATADPWIKQQLARNISLYETNYYRFRKSILPELMIGTNIVSGVVPNRDELYRLLTNQFNLQLP